MSDSSGNFTNIMQPGELKYVAIARVSDASLLLIVPSESTKKAYSEEVFYYCI